MKKIERYDLMRAFVLNIIPALIMLFAFYGTLISNPARAWETIPRTPLADQANLYDQLNIPDFDGCLPVAVFGGALSAIISMSFLMFKNKRDFYLGLEITRRRLFTNRVASAAVMLALGTGVPVAVLFFMNISHAGWNTALFACALQRFAALYLSAMAGFSLTALAAMFVGNLPELCVLSGVLLFFPSLVIHICDSMGVCYLHGYMDNGFGGSINTIYKALSVFDPLGFIGSASGGWEGDIILAGGEPPKTAPGFANILPLFVWTAIVSAVLAAVYYLIRRVEREKFGAMRSAAANCMYAAFGGTVALWITWMLSDSSFGLILGAGAVGFTVVYLLVWRNLSEIKRHLWHAAVFILPITAVFLIMVTGGFGFSSYQPPDDQIESVSVSVPGGALNTDDQLRAVDRLVHHARTVWWRKTFVEMKEAEDIKTVRSLHTRLIQNRSEQNTVGVRFDYKLKNGKTVSRYYCGCSNETLNSLTGIYRTQAADEMLKRILTDEKCDQSLVKLTDKLNLCSENMRIVADVSRYGEEWRKALFKALYTDIVESEYKNLLLPESRPIGYLLAYGRGQYDKSFYGEREVEMTDLMEGYHLFIYPDMQNTNRLLEEKGLLKRIYEYNGRKPSAVTVYKAAVNFDRYNRGYIAQITPWISQTRVKKTDCEAGEPVNKITDSAVIDKLYAASYSEYPAWKEGYSLAFEIDGYKLGRFIGKETYVRIVS